MKDAKTSALDIIYELPEKILILLSKLESLETRNAILEQKLNIILASNGANALPTDISTVSAAIDQNTEEQPEIMEIRHVPAPFSFEKKIEKQHEAPALTTSNKIEGSIKVPFKEVEPMPQNAIPAIQVSEKQTSTLVRGRLKEREGSSVAAVDVKIFDEKSVMVKKTKTAATGEWIAMLPVGEYTVEFTKPGQKPLFKPISIVAGKKELEVLI